MKDTPTLKDVEGLEWKNVLAQNVEEIMVNLNRTESKDLSPINPNQTYTMAMAVLENDGLYLRTGFKVGGKTTEHAQKIKSQQEGDTILKQMGLKGFY